MNRTALTRLLAVAAAAIFLWSGSAWAFSSSKTASEAQIAQDSWKPWGRLPQALAGATVVQLNGEAYFFGNVTRSGPTNLMWALDLRARTWRSRSPMPQMVAFAARAVLEGSIYVAGGCPRGDCGYPVSTVQVYDPERDVWRSIPPLPETIWGATGAALDGRFYVFGGMVGPNRSGVKSNRVYAFDPRTQGWSRLRDMPRARVEAAGAELDGRFLLTGGCVGTGSMPIGACGEISDTVDAYDARSDSWSPAPSLPTPLWEQGAFSDGSRIIVAGGHSEPSDAMGRVSTYVLMRGGSSWGEGPSLIRSRIAVQIFRLPKGIGLFGVTSNGSDDLIEALGAPAAPEDINVRTLDAAVPEPLPRSLQPPMVRVQTPAPIPAQEALPPFAAPRPHAHAVVIGVERYREVLPRADFAANDARSAAEYFKRVLGVPTENLVLLTDDRATKGDFEKYFERWLPNRVEKGDEVFVYYSGHGAPNPKTGESYLVPFDADPTYIEQTGYPIRRLYNQLAKLPAKSVLVALDSCFSGAGGRSVIARGARPLVTVVSGTVPPPLIVMTASSGDQISNSYQEKRHGLFTYFFLDGLKEKGSDFRAVYDFLRPQVSRIARREYNSDQDPQWQKGK